MFGRSRTAAVKEQAAAASELAAQLARDQKFRKQLIGATKHGSRAKRRAARRSACSASPHASRPTRSCGRGAADDARPAGRAGEAAGQAQEGPRPAQAAAAGGHRRAGRHRRRRRAGAAQARRMGAERQRRHDAACRRVVDRGRGAGVDRVQPVDAVRGVPAVHAGRRGSAQLDDTRLHWVASVGGRRAEWDAKILEQHPDRQISWISEDGRKTRGTVMFESRGEDRTFVRLSLGYQAEGFVEAVGSAAGLDRRRIEGDLVRFKELIEGRGTRAALGAEDISAGTTT